MNNVLNNINNEFNSNDSNLIKKKLLQLTSSQNSILSTSLLNEIDKIKLFAKRKKYYFS